MSFSIIRVRYTALGDRLKPYTITCKLNDYHIVTPYNLVEICRRFRRTFYGHCIFTEDERNIFIHKVYKFLPGYTISRSGTQHLRITVVVT